MISIYDDDGHRLFNDNNEVSFEEKGSIGSYIENGSRAFVKTYPENKIPVSLIVGEDTNSKSITQQYIRLRFGTNDGKQLVMLGNNKFYIVDSLQNEISYKEELSVKQIFDISTKLNRVVKDVSKLTSGDRTLINSIKFLTDDIEPNKMNLNDLDIGYDDITKKFVYYSATDKILLVLPKGMQKVNKLVRTKDDLPVRVYDHMLVGVLEDETILMYNENADEWSQVYLKSNEEVGDEYIVQRVYNDEYLGNATGSVIRTASGWAYIVHHNTI